MPPRFHRRAPSALSGVHVPTEEDESFDGASDDGHSVDVTPHDSRRHWQEVAAKAVSTKSPLWLRNVDVDAQAAFGGDSASGGPSGGTFSTVALCDCENR
jgi:hypothetical protein